MDIVASEVQRKKIHPHKFTLWVGIGSMIMMFAGLTSAYIVKREQPNWMSFEVPRIFWYSTMIMLASSLAIQWALRSFKDREMGRYRALVVSTLALGVVFILLQWIGFQQIWHSGTTLKGGSGAAQFLYIIFGLHALHVGGGIVALALMFIRAFNRKYRSYNSVPIELAATYWHFVDLLWIYLFVFFLWIQ
jgi:cytochrome c oxidase subunit III